MESIRERVAKFLRDFFAGAVYFEIEQTARKEKLARHDLFLLLTFGDLLGVPLVPPYYSLKILPYVCPRIQSWKKRMVRERDLTEITGL